MKYLKKLYGKAVIDDSDSEEIQIGKTIELEYYQTENKLNNKPYGIEIIKRNIENKKLSVEDKVVNNICKEEQDTNRLLRILMNNKVTPISVEDVIQDLKII